MYLKPLFYVTEQYSKLILISMMLLNNELLTATTAILALTRLKLYCHQFEADGLHSGFQTSLGYIQRETLSHKNKNKTSNSVCVCVSTIGLGV